jgi:sulfur carrier protein
MNVVVNGQDHALEDGASVRDVVRLLIDTDRGVAVSVDRAVVPRSEWDATALHQGAIVEVLVAAAGG